MSFLLLILLPILMMFTSWLKRTRDHNLLTQVHIGSVSASESAQDLTQFLSVTADSALRPSSGIRRNWIPGTTGTFDIEIDPSTTVRVTLTHEGYP
ncbi:MAG: hypothetical protein JNK54_07580 [Elusimicrobia bacterium]|nr:hypothetical protein [Elusimicrobiota bacterium]